MNNLIKANSRHGEAVFAKSEIAKGSTLIEFKGNIFRSDEIPKIQKPEDDRYLQVGKDLYIGPSGDLDDLINHSCDPNTGLLFSKKIILIAIKNIKKGEEITWDYSTTMDEDFWEMDCMCEAKKCRKKIRDFKHLPADIQNYYISLGVVPEYIIKKIKK